MSNQGIVKGQFALIIVGTSASYYGGYYGASFPGCGLLDWSEPTPARNRMWHLPWGVTTFPVYSSGYVQTHLAGTIRLPGIMSETFVADVLNNASERRFYWLSPAGERYMYVQDGDITSEIVENPLDDVTKRLATIGFDFACTRSQLYKASDDSIVWGG